MEENSRVFMQLKLSQPYGQGGNQSKIVCGQIRMIWNRNDTFFLVEFHYMASFTASRKMMNLFLGT